MGPIQTALQRQSTFPRHQCGVSTPVQERGPFGKQQNGPAKIKRGMSHSTTSCLISNVCDPFELATSARSCRLLDLSGLSQQALEGESCSVQWPALGLWEWVKRRRSQTFADHVCWRCHGTTPEEQNCALHRNISRQ